MGGGEVRLVGLVKRFEDVTAVDGIDLDVPGGEFFALLAVGLRQDDRPAAGRRVRAAHRGPHPARRGRHGPHSAPQAQGQHRFPELRPVPVPERGRQRRLRAALPGRAPGRGPAAGRRGPGPGPAPGAGEAAAGPAVGRPAAAGRPGPGAGPQPLGAAAGRALGALDAKLRKALQVELKALQEAVGITFVYVTHDQEEALTMSDRLAVMAGGRIEQVGSPTELYEEPATTYVAGFLGVANLFHAKAGGGNGGGRCRLRLGDFELEASGGDTAATGDVRVVIRPERVRLEPYGTSGPNRLPGMVERLVYQGPATQLVVRLANGDPLH